VRRSITSWADTWEHPIDDSSPTRETQEITDQLADAFQGISKVPEQVDDGIHASGIAAITPNDNLS